MRLLSVTSLHLYDIVQKCTYNRESPIALLLNYYVYNGVMNKRIIVL